MGVLQTDPEGTILLANPALARILGYEKPEDLIGLVMADDVYWDSTQRGTIIRRFDALGGGDAVEVQWKRQDGTPIWVDVHGALGQGWSGAVLRRVHLRSHEPQRARIAVPAGAEDGSRRPARGRRGARLQQSSHCDRELHGLRPR